MSNEMKISEQTQIAVLVEKVGTMSLTLTKLDNKFDIMKDSFASKEELVVVKNDVEELKGWKNKMLGALVAAQVVWGAVVYFVTKQIK